MPSEKVKTNLLSSKLGKRLLESHEEHRNDEASYGNPELPAGIKGAIAELKECRIGEYQSGDDKGQPFFIAYGIVVSPTEFNGLPILGLRTQIGPWALCDRPKSDSKKYKTFDARYAWMINQLRILGLDVSKITGKTPEEIEAKLLAGMKKLGEMKIHFSFRTWQSKPSAEYPNPMVTHEWNGAVDYKANGQTPSQTAAAGVREHSDNGKTEGDSSTGESESNLYQLIEQAESGDKDSRKQLVKLALEAGVAQEAIDSAKDWAEVGGLISNPTTTTTEDDSTEIGEGEGEGNEESGSEEGEGEEGPGEEEIPVWEPIEGNMCKYAPLDPKDKEKKKRLKPITCEITGVASDGKLTLKNMVDGKTVYKNVKPEVVTQPD